MAGKTVLFFDPNPSERGASVATSHYARYNEELLGNTSLIAIGNGSDPMALDQYRRRFAQVHVLRSTDDIYRLSGKADLLYLLIRGSSAGLDLNRLGCRTGLHCVFTAHNPHGDVYAAISEWVVSAYALKELPVVPHIVHLPQVDGSLRAELGIPEDAVVFGRYGGYDQFNIPSVMQTIAFCLLHREDVYFLFMNTAPFFGHPRLIFLPKNGDETYKARFVNTCDAMIHARMEGETFGLTIGEFSLRRKPVIAWYWSCDRYHIQVLGDHGLYYRTPPELYRILMSFRKGEERPDCYSDKFNPQRVMAQFEKVFLA